MSKLEELVQELRNMALTADAKIDPSIRSMENQLYCGQYEAYQNSADLVNQWAESKPKRRKWRTLGDEETWIAGDRWRIDGGKWTITTLTDPDYTIGEWRKSALPKSAEAQRRVTKRPGLKRLVERLQNTPNWGCAETCITIYSDGTGHIENPSNEQRLFEFVNITELKDYLASLPEKGG